MKKVFMSPNNGALVVGIPLVGQSEFKMPDNYMVTFNFETEVLAYLIDFGDPGSGTLLSADWVHSHLIDMGDL